MGPHNEGHAVDPTLRGGGEIERFAASDGYTFAYRRWRAAGTNPPRGYVVGLHGIQSHSGWYADSSRRLAAEGFEVLFLDRRGSGLNEALRGHAPHAERLINDVAQFLTALRRRRDAEAAAAPVVLMSVSWGGKLAAATAVRRPDLVDALALLYPGIFALVRPSWRQEAVIRAVRWFDIKWRRIPIPLNDPELFTADAGWQAFIRRDPLALREATVGFQHANRDLDRIVRDGAGRIRCPVLLMLAGRDRLADNRATARFLEQIPSTDKTLIEYADAVHTLEFEPDREPFLADLLGWLARQARASDGGSGLERSEAPDP
jgi:alpha-beta hydrolase superfamily lysophospholipase